MNNLFELMKNCKNNPNYIPTSRLTSNIQSKTLILTNLDIFKTEKLATGIYCYHTESTSNITYFGFVRKIPAKGRIHSEHNTLVGAAGTEEKYFGKWTTIGGSAKGDKTNIERAIDEFNDDTGIKERLGMKFNNKEVDFSHLGMNKPPIPSRLVCRLAQNYNNKVAIFLFEIPDEKLFFNIFPRGGVTSDVLAKTSKGEIDAIQSYNMKEIVELQTSELKKGQNYFTKYSIDTFHNLILPKMFELILAFQKKWTSVKIDVIEDTTPREPFELTHSAYSTKTKYIKELDNSYDDKYHKYKIKYLKLKSKLGPN